MTYNYSTRCNYLTSAGSVLCLLSCYLLLFSLLPEAARRCSTSSHFARPHHILTSSTTSHSYVRCKRIFISKFQTDAVVCYAPTPHMTPHYPHVKRKNWYDFNLRSMCVCVFFLLFRSFRRLAPRCSTSSYCSPLSSIRRWSPLQPTTAPTVFTTFSLFWTRYVIFACYVPAWARFFATVHHTLHYVLLYF